MDCDLPFGFQWNRNTGRKRLGRLMRRLTIHGHCVGGPRHIDAAMAVQTCMA
jgi:hypothetical protein